MGYSITKNSNQIAYGIKKFIVDTPEDLTTLYGGSPGSTAFCLSNSTEYIFNTKNKWIANKNNKGSNSNSQEINHDSGEVTPNEQSDDTELILDGNTP